MELERMIGKGIKAAVYFDANGYVYSASPRKEIDLDIVDDMTMLAKNECSVRSCARCGERAACSVAVFPLEDKFLGIVYDKPTDLSRIEERVMNVAKGRITS